MTGASRPATHRRGSDDPGDAHAWTDGTWDGDARDPGARENGTWDDGPRGDQALDDGSRGDRTWDYGPRDDGAWDDGAWDDGPDGLPTQRLALVDLLDRVLAGGVVITGDITLSIADVDLVVISLRALLTSVSALVEPVTGNN